MNAPVPRALEFPTLFAYILLAAASSAICVQINVYLGITPNTAVVGVLAAMALGRTALPLFRSAERQVMVETATSAGGFAGANIALVSLATLYLLGLERLVLPLLAGISLGMVLDIWLASRLFGTRAFPADAAWPDGEAIGRVIQAGDQGGTLARQLLQGVAAGAVGRLIALPMAGVGIAFIGNPAALAALAAGLIIRTHGATLGYDVAVSHVPHGMMIGAGLVQVAQTVAVVWRSRPSGMPSSSPHRQPPADRAVGLDRAPRPASAGTADTLADSRVDLRELAGHLLLFIAAAALVALLAGLWGSTAAARWTTVWVLYAGVAALVHTVIVGYCAMLSGWFPSFAVAIALILVAALLRLPVEALALLAGFVMSTGPQFADLGYDLKSGWIVRGRGADATREAAGRRQQVWLQEIGALVGLATAALAFSAYWRLGLVPPMSRAVAATVTLAATPALMRELSIGAVAGGLAQAAGGARRALGILLATGLLLNNPAYGYTLAAALAVRAWVGSSRMTVRAPGLIAGDGLAGFALALARAF